MDNYFIQAQKIRRLVQHDFNRVFTTPNPLVDDAPETNTSETTVDVIVCPTAPTLAPSLVSIKDQDPISAYMNDVFTVPASLAGLPSISVPVRITRDDQAAEQPFEETAGIQIIGQYGDDDCVLVAADVVSRIAPTSQAQRDAPDVTSWGASTSE
jgi:aspartyl-tRNA(Asn)/glutamyl-tRNA(Gln) amidotransferase subunit A